MLQSMGLQIVRHDLATEQQQNIYCHSCPWSFWLEVKGMGEEVWSPGPAGLGPAEQVTPSLCCLGLS